MVILLIFGVFVMLDCLSIGIQGTNLGFNIDNDDVKTAGSFLARLVGADSLASLTWGHLDSTPFIENGLSFVIDHEFRPCGMFKKWNNAYLTDGPTGTRFFCHDDCVKGWGYSDECVKNKWRTWLAQKEAERKALYESEFRKEFNAVDVNGDGFIDVNELCNLLKTILGQELDSTKCVGVMALADKNGDDVISFDEFKGFFNL